MPDNPAPGNHSARPGPRGPGDCRSFTEALHFLRTRPEGSDPRECMFGDLVDDLDTAETAALCALTYFPQPVKVEHLAASAGAGSDESAAAMPETPGGAAHAPLSVVEIERALGRLAERALVVPGDEFQSFTLPPGGADFLREKKTRDRGGDRRPAGKARL